MADGARLSAHNGVYGFEAIPEALPYIPLAARRVLDASGLKLPLDGWLSLPIEHRWQVVRAGVGDVVDTETNAFVVSARPPPARLDPPAEPDARSPPGEVVAALGPARPLDDARWKALSGLDRYALAKCAAKPDKLARAYDEILGVSVFSHLTGTGAAHMVDISGKAATARRAVASACVRTTKAVLEAIASGGVAKGDVIATARIAGILAAKRTSELIPLCHPVKTTRAAIEFLPDLQRAELRVKATVEAIDRTGVEMEAMVAATIASLTVYDMIKSVDRWASVDAVRLDAKSGGKSGDVIRPRERKDP